MAALEIQGLCKSFGTTRVLRQIDLSVNDGEMLVIVGASGCGKSTLLRLVAGLETPTEGRISIGGRDVTALDPSERDIAMVFQNYALYPHMSVFDNMAYGLRIRGLSRGEIMRKVEEAAALLGLEALLARKPRQLSGGQRQRVAMGRAIVRDPKLFLFDEPLSNLDAKLRVQMRTELKKLRIRVPTTTIYVTHDQVEAMTLADRIVVLNHGRVEQVGTPEDVYETPASIFVAGFMGAPAMNLLPARLEGGRLILENGTVLPCNRSGDREVWCGVRPEALEWMPSAPTPNGACLRGTALSVEPLGPDTLVSIEIAGAELACRLPPRSVRRAGEPVALTINAEGIHLFDRASGKRL